MRSTTLCAWLVLATCALSGCGKPESCAGQTCQDIVNQIEVENANHPEFNPDHRADICGDATGVDPLPHYAVACEKLRTCLAECE